MSLVESTLLAIAVSHLSLVVVYILLRYRDQYLAQLIALFVVCLISYFLGSASGEYFNPVTADYIFRRFGNFCPILVWLIAHELFIDRQKIAPIVWLLTGTYIILRAVGAVYLLENTTFDSSILFLTYVFPQIVMIGFVFHALYIAVRGYDADLVIARREERIAFVASISMLLLVIAVNTSNLISNLMFSSFFNNTFGGLLIPTYIYSAYTYITISIFFLWRFRVSYSSMATSDAVNMNQIESVNSNIKIQKSQIRLIERIKQAMEEDKLYLRNKLTVHSLADHISSQEYLVRRAINSHLQYRNFSDFVNHYRILEAARRLTETDESISNIGLDVGYSSLSAFHRAFKEKYAVTPKEFRIKEQQI